MKKITQRSFSIGFIALIVCMATLTETNAQEKIRYSCSAQVYEAFENIRLDLFSEETGIAVELFVSSSKACINSVLQDKSDIASSARPLYRRYKDYGLHEIPVYKDPLAIITNQAITVTNLTGSQLQQIFSGNITNWKEVGGADLPIIIVVPDENTGAHKNFRRQVMKHKEIQYDYSTYKSTRVLEAIEHLPTGAISFISRGAQFTHKKIKAMDIEGKKADDKAYPYYQIIYIVTPGKPKGSIKTFVDFIKSAKGDAIIRERGMLPIKQAI